MGAMNGLVKCVEMILIVMFGALMIGAGDLTMGQLIAVSMLAARAITPATGEGTSTNALAVSTDSST